MSAPSARLAALEPFAARMPEANRELFWHIAAQLPDEQISIFRRVAPKLSAALEAGDYDAFSAALEPELDRAGYGAQASEYAGMAWGILHQ